MSKRLVYTLSFATLLASSAAVAANMEAGLWELTTESATAKSLPQMPPAQIEQMRRLGIDLSKLQSGMIVNQVCITPEMAAKNELPRMNNKESGCQIKNQEQHGNTYTMDMMCDGQMQGKGTMKTVFASKKSFSSRMQFEGNMSGLPINDNTSTSGKWLGADCGSVKPISPQR